MSLLKAMLELSHIKCRWDKVSGLDNKAGDRSLSYSPSDAVVYGLLPNLAASHERPLPIHSPPAVRVTF